MTPPFTCRQNLAAVGKKGKGEKREEKRGGEEERREEKRREREKEEGKEREKRKKRGKKEEEEEDKEKGRAVVGLIYYRHPSPNTLCQHIQK